MRLVVQWKILKSLEGFKDKPFTKNFFPSFFFLPCLLCRVFLEFNSIK
jgi:hypothetical protein